MTILVGNSRIGCLMEICECTLYKGKPFIMSKSKEKKEKIKREKSDQGKLKETLLYPILVSVLSELILSIGIICVGKFLGFLSLPSMVKSIDERVKVLEEAKNSSPDDTPKPTTTIETNLDGTATIIITGKGNLPLHIEEGYEEPEYKMTAPSNILDDTCDRETGEKYTLNQLVDKKLLISYADGDYENYFYGQFNENNHWDGNCITNIYKDDNLFFIMEADYNDGSLTSYKQAFKCKTLGKKEVWSVAKRSCVIDQETKESYNTGETWNYFYIDYSKQFDIDNVKTTNIRYVDSFRKELQEKSSLEGYYHGNTSKGSYNDSTGDAYMLKYSEDGFIRALYVGIFEDGYLNDQSGNAWEIVLDRSNNINKYFYYKGTFTDGFRDGQVSKDNYITKIDREKYIHGMVFNCELNWYDLND